MSLAIETAGLEPENIDLVFADAFGDSEWDAIEARAIKHVFGDRRVPVTAPKTMVGRLYAGGAALDVAAALLAIRDSVIPPAINIDDPAPDCDLDLVIGQAREAELRNVLVSARGFGGFNGALVLRAAD